MSERTADDLPRNSRIRTIDFNDDGVREISALLRSQPGRAEFQLPGSTVWQLTVDGTNGRPQALVTLWPGIGRVDVVSGPATVVFTKIVKIDLVPDVEVQFRRGTKECLIIARNGQVIVRA